MPTSSSLLAIKKAASSKEDQPHMASTLTEQLEESKKKFWKNKAFKRVKNGEKILQKLFD